MIYKVPKEFSKGFENHTKLPYQKNINYTESDYELITLKIEEIFGYEVIHKKYYEPILTHSKDYLRVFDKYGEIITNKYGGDLYSGYLLDGILTYDEYYKRFVIFQFRENFVHRDSSFHIIDGISWFSSHYKSLGIHYNNEFIKNSKEGDINTELTKLIVIFKNSQSSQLMKYFDSFKNHNKIVELWKLTEIDNETTIIEDINVDYKEVKWFNNEMSEYDFFKLFHLDKKNINKYEIFKEYLKFNFNDIIISLRVEESKVDEFISTSYGDYDNEEYNFIYKNSNYKIDRTQSIPFLKKYLNDFVDHYNNLFLGQRDKLEYENYLKYLKFSINVKFEWWDFDSNNKMLDSILFNFSFNNNEIKIKNIFNNLTINNETSYLDIKNFIDQLLNSFFETKKQ
ncbi:hypothetical protein ACM55F_02495 [Flavobacterium sp. XS2P12]|uniref:hypothetical protein n=1 Tax=Flavobacterium melibiosi TaxID=3398734 RepID=UPI003A8B6DDF